MKGRSRNAESDRLIFLYTTVASRQSATLLVETLLKERLIACGNISSPVISLYRWNGKVQGSQEFVVILKSRSKLRDKLVRLLRSIHEYDVPCIVELKTKSLNLDYWQWLKAETPSTATPKDSKRR